MSSEIKKLNAEDLDNVAGGAATTDQGTWKSVSGLIDSEMAMRTAPTFDYSNIMGGCNLSNGDKVQVKGAPIIGSDGRQYVLVYSPASGKTGYVNAAFLT